MAIDKKHPAGPSNVPSITVPKDESGKPGGSGAPPADGGEAETRAWTAKVRLARVVTAPDPQTKGLGRIAVQYSPDHTEREEV